MPHRDAYDAIAGYVDSLPVFSDHEHHLPDAFFAEGMSLDKAINSSYVAWTGFTSDGTEASRKRLLDNVRFNSYFIWFERGVQRLHEFDEPIEANTWDRVSERIAAAHEDPDFHWRSLLDMGYEKHVLDAYWNPGDDNGRPEIFVPTFRIDKFMYGHHAEAIAPDDFAPWKRYGFEGGRLDDYVDLMKATIRERYEQCKVAALKCAEAYMRPVSFLPDDRDAAQRAWGVPPEKLARGDFLLFGNYIFNRCCELAQELELPFQVHTGLAEIGGSNPMGFEPVIKRYPGVRFVLFHAGYPWTGEVAGLAHNYANVLPSLTWTPLISTTAALRALHEFLDAACSVNAITWGSDCWTPEESVGAQLAWRHVVATVIAERMASGLLRSGDAEKLARKLLYENNRRIYMHG